MKDLSYIEQISQQEFKERRLKFIEKMQANSCAIIFSSIEKVRNRDCNFLFRQDSYFWYLTGFNEPDSAIVLVKGENNAQEIIFVRPKDLEKEIWNGLRLGVEQAKEQLEFDKSFDIANLETEFLKILANCKILYKNEEQPWGDELVKNLDLSNLEIANWQTILDEMRLFKSDAEIDLIQKACEISSLAHIKAMKITQPNKTELAVEGEILYEFTRHASRFAAYNSIVAGGANACILHYNENNQPLKDGDLLLIDAGAEFANYGGDISRTIPVNGKFSQAQKEIYSLVLKSQKEAIAMLKPGVTMKQAYDLVVEILTTGLVDLGILQGDVKELIDTQAYKQFFMHGLGHLLGLDIHDVGDMKNNTRPLEKGMIVTIEPGLYIAKDAKVPAQYQGIGVRIEDNILITDTGNKNLTSSCPKEIADIEQIMQ